MACVVIARKGPTFKPLLAMTTASFYQRTINVIIHLNDNLSIYCRRLSPKRFLFLLNT